MGTTLGDLACGLTLSATIFALSGTAPSAAAAPGRADLVGRCPTTRNLAPENWREAANGRRLDALDARIRGGLTADVPDGAAIVLRAFGGASETQQTATESAAVLWRTADGAWRFHKVDHRPHALPPPGSERTDEDRDRTSRTVTAGVLARDSSEALDRLLADPCLEAEPTSPGPQVAVRAGVENAPPCSSYSGGTVEIRRGAGRKIFALFCPRMLSGELLAIALYPRPDDPDAPVAAAPARTYESVETARDELSRVLAQNRAEDSLRNVTSTPTPEVLHPPSGVRCQLWRSPRGFVVSGSHPGESSRLWCATRFDDLRILTSVSRAPPQGTARQALMDFAGTQFADSLSEDGGGRELRPVRRGQLHYATAVFPDRPQADARDEKVRRVNAAVADGWAIVQAVEGPAERSEAIDALSAESWNRLLETRDPPAGTGD